MSRSRWTGRRFRPSPASTGRGYPLRHPLVEVRDALARAAVAPLLERAGLSEDAGYLLAESPTGYTTNLPLSDVIDHPALVAFEADGGPLEPEHGGPMRLFVPHYFWSFAKWLSRLQVLEHDELGFWERNGYHHRGDPWAEERHSVSDYVARAMRRDARNVVPERDLCQAVDTMCEGCGRRDRRR